MLVRANSDYEAFISPVSHRKSSETSSYPDSRDPLVEANVVADLPSIIECPFQVEIAKNHSGRPQLFGQGAWSKVYRAMGRSKYTASPTLSSGLLTPPPSPETSVPLLVAVKAPTSNASHTILQNEAMILTHLTRTPGHGKFVVPFYGYLPSSNSLVLGAIQLSLSDHISSRARIAHSNHAEVHPTEPILGSTSIWLSLANKLITALAWLHHTAAVVHGDIKPGNILLSPSRISDPFPFDPLLIDFSSSHLRSSPENTPNTLSAVTREYTAPELLSPSVLRDPLAKATIASDVFSLAITLIVSVTGDAMVYQGNVWQRQYMATQGWNVLDFVRHAESGVRVPMGGVVEKVVQDAVKKIDDGRIDAGEWRGLVKRMIADKG